MLLWVTINAAGMVHFDKYPFILLNLAFSLQAAYAAPLILLAQTRQAHRDKVWSDADTQHREEIGQSTLARLRENTELTSEVAELARQINELTKEIHTRVIPSSSV